jgi:two-component system response regulator HydG
MSSPPSTASLPSAGSVLECFPTPAVLVSADYRILAVNQAYDAAFSNGAETTGQHCYRVSHGYRVPCDQAGEDCPLRKTVQGGDAQRALHLHHTPRGLEHVDIEAMPIRDQQGKVIAVLELLHLLRGPGGRAAEPVLVGRSAAFARVLELVRRVAGSEAAVVLLGESGTGKELVAQAIHDGSRRAAGPFVPLECSGLTETLFESELFGYEKGAFSGAQSRKIGLVEAARGGTLFLDEVGDIPLSLQVKLLRLLETSTFRRVGGVEPQRADFRLVCATHRDLRARVAAGAFRQDLYYRINTFPIDLPPLRDRLEDLPLLVQVLLNRVASGRQMRLQPEAMECLRRYSFPGNIRELRNILERASLLAAGDVILPEHVSEVCEGGGPPAVPARFHDVVPLQEMETRYLQWAAAAFPGDRRSLAAALGLSERTLYRKLQATEYARRQ